MNKKIICALLILCIMGILTACAEKSKGGLTDPVELPDGEEPNDLILDGNNDTQSGSVSSEDSAKTEEVNVQGDIKTVADAVNKFDHDFFQKAATDKNLFYSSYSLLNALALLDNAAEGDTKAELEEVLGITDIAAFNSSIKEYLKKGQNEQARVSTANGIWVSKEAQFAPEYESEYKPLAEEYFEAVIKEADFKNDLDGVKKDISGWVSDKTEGMIGDYTPLCDESTIVDIVNAVYFYGEWQKKFDASDTYDGDFNGLNKTSNNVSLMRMDDKHFRFTEDENGIKAIALPYGDGSKEMDIFIPADGQEKNIVELMKGLDAAAEQALIEKLNSAEEETISKVIIPKFTFDNKIDNLSDILKEMGIKSAFENKNEFTKIAQDLVVSDIGHKAKIEVDEEGSRAAAVTEAMMNLTSVAESDRKLEFIADKPFVFVIRDKDNNLILFRGMITEL
ncbi:MAG: hypothetical protein K6F99_07275 [Lachnospiraceae bacterium]|nr:hypothetical protein [Lachnospiraceae bacterium]